MEAARALGAGVCKPTSQSPCRLTGASPRPDTRGQKLEAAGELLAKRLEDMMRQVRGPAANF
jgi:hypothetical protein